MGFHVLPLAGSISLHFATNIDDGLFAPRNEQHFVEIFVILVFLLMGLNIKVINMARVVTQLPPF